MQRRVPVALGEIEAFRDAEIRPWELLAMATQDRDIPHYQPVLFAVTPFEQMWAVVDGCLR